MKKILFGMLLTSFTLPALADSPFSIEAIVGNAYQELDFGGGETPEGDDISVGLRAAYSFNENVAVEFAYFDYGIAEDNYVDSFGDDIHDELKSSSMNLGLKGSIPLASNMSVFGRFGFARWDWEITETDSSFPGEEFNGDDSGTDLYYGVGMDFKLSEQVKLGAEFTYLEMDIDAGDNSSVDNEVRNFAIFVGYNF